MWIVKEQAQNSSTPQPYEVKTVQTFPAENLHESYLCLYQKDGRFDIEHRVLITAKLRFACNRIAAVAIFPWKVDVRCPLRDNELVPKPLKEKLKRDLGVKATPS